MSDARTALAVEEVVAGYGGVLALQSVSITVRPATITAVLGANGAGKTTLLRAISGVIRPRRGRVLVGGQDLTGRSAEDMARGGVAHVPEGQGVIAELTVQENLRLGALWRPGRADPGRGAGRGLPAVPGPRRGPEPGGRDPVRRRAADAASSRAP